MTTRWGGIGNYKGDPVWIQTDESVPPVAQPPHIRKQVENKLHELEAADIIEGAEGPTPWVFPSCNI